MFRFSEQIREDFTDEKSFLICFYFCLQSLEQISTIPGMNSFEAIYVSLSFLILNSSPKIVAISPCMKAHGTVDPTKGHFSPLGQ